MMKRILFGLGLAFWFAGLAAADLTTTTGTTYRNAEIDKPTPYGLSIIHDTGSATVPFDQLPEGLRQQYAEYEKKAPAMLEELSKQPVIQVSNVWIEQLLQDNELLLGGPVKVQKVLAMEQGFLAERANVDMVIADPFSNTLPSWPIFIKTPNFQALADGQLFYNDEVVYVYTQTHVTSGWKMRFNNDIETAPPEKKTDVVKSVRCWRIGVYLYEEDGTTKRLAQYAATRQEAAQFYHNWLQAVINARLQAVEAGR